MAIKTYKPTTKSLRMTSVVDYSEILTRKSPENPLPKGKNPPVDVTIWAVSRSVSAGGEINAPTV